MNIWRRSEEAVYVAATMIVTVIVWEIAVRVLSIQAFVLPAPSAIFDEFVLAPAYLAQNALYTLYSTLAGFALAVVIGLGLAVAIVHSKFLERTLYAYLIVLNSIPKVALAPLFVMWLGVGAEPKIAIALMIAVFSIVIDAILGLRSVDPDMLSLARASRASQWHILIKIRLPNALPSIFAGLKVGISFALVGAIVGEFVAGQVGLGAVILQAQGSFDSARAFAAIVRLAVMGTLLFYLVEVAERMLLPWHTSQRGKHGSSVVPQVAHI
jgi:NitT/TauT family transport system permease protein